MKIELRTIDNTNKADVILLEVADSQKEYIAANQVSLETAQSEEYIGIARPFAIYADDKLVGFTMFAFELNSSDPNDRYWLWRFMIDKKLQGNGYGSAALEKIIEYFKSHVHAEAKRLIPWAIIAPIVFSGLIEIGQQTLTPTRAADWWDFLCNSLGCLAAALFSQTVTRRILKR